MKEKNSQTFFSFSHLCNKRKESQSVEKKKRERKKVSFIKPVTAAMQVRKDCCLDDYRRVGNDLLLNQFFKFNGSFL